MGISDLKGMKTEMRAQKARRAIRRQPRNDLKKFRRDTVGREKAEVATVLFARFIFRHRRREFGKILAMAQAGGDIQHLAILCFCYLRRGPLRTRQQNGASTHAQRWGELSSVLLQIL